MPIFGPLVTALANVPRAAQAELSALYGRIMEAAGANRRGIFFRAVNAAVGLLGQLGVPGASRALASALVRYERSARQQAAVLQRELEGSGETAEVPVDPKLGQGQTRTVVSIDVAGVEGFAPTRLFISVRLLGLPTENDITNAVAEQLEEWGEDYEVPQARLDAMLQGLQILRVEGGG